EHDLMREFVEQYREFMERLDTRFHRIRHRRLIGYKNDWIRRVTISTSKGICCTWLWIRERHLLCGLWALSEEELSNLLLLRDSSSRRLRRALEEMLFDPWDDRVMPAKVSSCVQLWLRVAHYEECVSLSIEWSLHDVPTGTFHLGLRSGAELTERLKLSPE